jgi:hypothetical protein
MLFGVFLLSASQPASQPGRGGFLGHLRVQRALHSAASSIAPHSRLLATATPICHASPGRTGNLRMMPFIGVS